MKTALYIVLALGFLIGVFFLLRFLKRRGSLQAAIIEPDTAINSGANNNGTVTTDENINGWDVLNYVFDPINLFGFRSEQL